MAPKLKETFGKPVQSDPVIPMTAQPTFMIRSTVSPSLTVIFVGLINGSAKVAAFDLDGTLIRTKSGASASFARSFYLC